MSGMTLILDEYGVRHPPSDTRWCSIKCVNPDHDDDHASARVHVEAGAYICLGCGLKASSPARLIMQLRGMTWREANEYIISIGGGRSGSSKDGFVAMGTWTAHRGKRYSPPRGRLRRLRTQ